MKDSRFAMFIAAARCAAVLVLSACGADGNRAPVETFDAASPSAAVEASTPSAMVDASMSAPVDASTPKPADAAAPGTLDAMSPSAVDAAAPSASDTATAEASAADGTAPNPSDAAMSGGERPPAVGLALPTVKESPGVEPWFNVTRPSDMAAAVAATGQLLPVIVWANGGCFRSDDTWAPLFKRWASAGFVVITLSTKPMGGILDALGQTSKVEHAKIIDWALDQAKKEGSPYRGMIDASRVVAAGNSCGGVTALEVAAMDRRVASVFVLSGSSAVGSSSTAIMKSITAPVGYVVGGSEDIAGANASADYDNMNAGIPSAIVSRAMGDHVTVSTDVMILADVAEIALNWLDLSLYGTPDALKALSAPSVCASCKNGPWMLKAKNLEKLQK